MTEVDRMGNIEHPQQGGAKTKVCCPNCGRTLGDVIESIVRQRGRFKAQRNEARRELAGAVEALREIKRVAAIEAPPVSEEVPAKVWKLAFDALGRIGGQ